jgi:hypothetical protein
MTVAVDGARPNTTRSQGPEIVGEGERNHNHRYRREAPAHPLDVDGLPARSGVGRDHQDADAGGDRPAERVVDGHHGPLTIRMVPPKPRQKIATPYPVRLEPRALRFRVVREVPFGGETDGDGPPDSESRFEQTLVAQVEVVERPSQDRPAVSPHGGSDLQEYRQEDDGHERDGPIENVGVHLSGAEQLLPLSTAGLGTGLVRRVTYLPADFAMTMVAVAPHEELRDASGV